MLNRDRYVSMLCAMIFVAVGQGTGARAGEPRGEGGDSVYVSREEGGRLEIVAIPLDGGERRILFTRPKAPQSVALGPHRDLVVVKDENAPIEIDVLGTATRNVLPGTENCGYPWILRGGPWLVCTRALPEDKFTVEIYDYRERVLVRSISGEAPRQALADDSLFVVRSFEATILRYDPAKDSVHTVVKVDIGDGDHGIAEVVPVSRSRFFYLVPGEDWSLWYDQRGGVLLDWDRKRHPWAVEQANLVTDRAGTRAVFTELDGRDRPQLIVVDLKTGVVRRLADRGLPLLVEDERIVFIDATGLSIHSMRTGKTKRLCSLTGTLHALP